MGQIVNPGYTLKNKNSSLAALNEIMRILERTRRAAATGGASPGSATEAKQDDIINAMRDAELLLVKDTGNGNAVVRQAVVYDQDTQVWSSPVYFNTDGTLYTPVGPLEYMNSGITKDVEINLVRDTGNSDLIVQQIRLYDDVTATWSTSYQNVSGATYTPIGTLSYVLDSAKDFEISIVKDAGNDQMVQQIRVYDVVNNTWSTEYRDVAGAIYTPVGAIEYVDSNKTDTEINLVVDKGASNLIVQQIRIYNPFTNSWSTEYQRLDGTAYTTVGPLDYANNLNSDIEINLVRDIGNANQVVQQVRVYDNLNSSYSTIYQDINGASYTTIGPLEYLQSEDSTSNISLVRDAGNSDLIVQQVRLYDGRQGTWSTSYQEQDGTSYTPVGVLTYVESIKQDSELIPVVDTGNSNEVVVQVRTLDLITGVWTITYQELDGTAYTPTGPLELLSAVNKDVEVHLVKDSANNAVVQQIRIYDKVSETWTTSYQTFAGINYTLVGSPIYLGSIKDDIEINLVRDTGNSDQIVQQIRTYDLITETWSTSYQDVNNAAYVITGPIEYIDNKSLLQDIDDNTVRSNYEKILNEANDKVETFTYLDVADPVNRRVNTIVYSSATLALSVTETYVYGGAAGDYYVTSITLT